MSEEGNVSSSNQPTTALPTFHINNQYHHTPVITASSSRDSPELHSTLLQASPSSLANSSNTISGPNSTNSSRSGSGNGASWITRISGRFDVPTGIAVAESVASKDVKSFATVLCTLMGDVEAISFLEHTLSYLLSKNDSNETAFEFTEIKTTIVSDEDEGEQNNSGGDDTGGSLGSSGKNVSLRRKKESGEIDLLLTELPDQNSVGEYKNNEDVELPITPFTLAFAFLDYNALCNASLVSKQWSKLALAPVFWQYFFKSYENKIASTSTHITTALTTGAITITHSPDIISKTNPNSTQQEVLPPLRPQIDGGVLRCGMDSVLKFPRFASLVSLDMTPWKSDVDDRWIINNMTQLTNLRHLGFRDCSRVELSSPWVFYFTNLVSLDLGTKVTSRGITNDSLLDVSKLTRLLVLNLHHCEKISEAGMKHIATLPRLRDLDIGDCYKLGKNTLSLLTPLAKTLTRLVMLSPVRSNSFIDDNSLEPISNFTHLKSLDLGWCINISDNGMKYVAHLTNLAYLGLGSTSVSDAGLSALTSLTNLTGLNVQLCDKVTASGVSSLFSPNMKLKSINFNGVPIGKAGSRPFKYLGTMPLEELDLTNTYIDDDGLKPDYYLKLPNLKRISVGFNPITDVGVNYVTTSTQVQYIDVSHCPKLTDKSLEHFANCKSLRVVDISNIYRISQSALEKLRAKRPDMKIITQKHK